LKADLPGKALALHWQCGLKSVAGLAQSSTFRLWPVVGVLGFAVDFEFAKSAASASGWKAESGFCISSMEDEGRKKNRKRQKQNKNAVVVERRRRLVREQPQSQSPSPAEKKMEEEEDIEDIIPWRFSGDETQSIRESLLEWYDLNKRDLPWRSKKLESPSQSEEEERGYGVWVSEVMLQQTRVQTVIQYYNRWMSKWPSIHHLSQASLEVKKTLFILNLNKICLYLYS
jgi:hypothetical protein